MKLIFLFCIIPLVYSGAEGLPYNMIVSFIKNDDNPVSVLTPRLCWSPYQQLRLAESLHKVGVSMAASLQPQRMEYYLQHIVIIVDLVCPQVQHLFYNATKKSMFKSPYRWLLLDTQGRGKYWSLLEDLPILVDSDVIVAQKINEEEYLFTEAYKVTKTSDVVYSSRCLWRATNKKHYQIEPSNNNTNITTPIPNGHDDKVNIHMLNKEVKVSEYGMIEDYRTTTVISARRANLRKSPLTMALVLVESNETKLHIGDRLNLHQDSISKMTYQMVRICFEMLNATEQVIFTNTWGYKEENGNWQGLIQHLLMEEADLGTLTLVTAERNDVIDYIAMVGTTSVRFVFREPPLALVSNIFTLPFQGPVWMAIFISVLGCALFLYVTSKWETTMGMHREQLDGSWADVLILIIGAVLQQGCTIEPRYTAGRCVTLFLFMSLTILYAAYSANIVVLLRAPSSSVRTLQDLLNSPIKLGASDFEYNRYFFKKLNEPLRKTIYEKKIAPKGKKPNFYSMTEGVEKIRKGLFAFHMELNPGYRLIQETYQEHEKCDLVEMDYTNIIDPWLPGQKRAPLKDLFKINFIRIRETGIQACHHHRLQVAKPKCSGQVSTFSSVGITDVYPAMLATLYGMLMAPAVLLLEISYHRLITIKEKKMALRGVRDRDGFLDNINQ